MLKVNNLKVSYSGTICALKGVNLHVEVGEIVTFIGANGAGKTTLLKALTGLVKADDDSSAELDLSELNDIRTLNRIFGEKTTDALLKEYSTSEKVFEAIRSDQVIDKKITGKTFDKLKEIYHQHTYADLMKIQAYDCIKYGLAHVPEGRQVFSNLTVQENLEMGAYRRNKHLKIKKDIEEMFTMFPRLGERKNQKAGTLSGGEQQMLAVARALMSKPKLILLDEPSMGLSPIYVSEIFQIIKDLNKKGITIILVEQNAKAALNICTRGYVLETGNIVLEGTGEQLLNDERVKKAYLGT